MVTSSSLPEGTPATRRALAWRVLAWLAVAAVLAAVFMSYLQPELMVDLANRLWSCF